MAKKIEKEKFIRNKEHCNIGTIGHVDHGKTTLTSAITKYLSSKGKTKFKNYEDIDSHPEEIQRKITINAAHVEYETEKRHYSHVDCPGHQDYIKNMIMGASQMDGVILVVSAVDGVQVQTREHVILAREIGIKDLIVFLNKVDIMKDKEMLELTEIEIRELIENYGYSSDTPIVKGSAKLALDGNLEEEKNIETLVNLMDNYIKLPERKINEPFIMSVGDVYVAQGRGTVVTGTVEKGKLNIGDELELITRKKNFKTQCLGIETYRKVLDTAEVGDNVGILIKNVPNQEVKRGDVLAFPGVVKNYKKFKARIVLLKEEEGGRKKPFQTNYKPQLFFRTTNITGTIIMEKDKLAFPGETLLVVIDLLRKTVLNEGLHFVLREGQKTIGAGVVRELIE